MANNYPIWWDQTLTVYNKYEDPTTHAVTWFKSTLTDCFWQTTYTYLVVGSNKVKTTQTVCRIPVSDDYRDKSVWDNLSVKGKTKFFTLSYGDIIIKGDASDEIDEYVSGHRSTDLISKYKYLQRCMVVDFHKINTGVGRGNEHYRVEGL